MKQLIEDYQRRLNSINTILEHFKSNGSINDCKKEERFKTKAGEYRTIITELERIVKRDYVPFNVIKQNDKERIQISYDGKADIYLIKSDMGFIIDVYNNLGENIFTETIWDDDLSV